MARLSNDQIKDLLKRPKNSEYIALAIKQERRLAFHTNCAQDKRQLNSAYRDWLDWVRSILPSDKWETFEKIVTVPIQTNKQVETIWTELSKVFQSQNSQKKAQFIDKSLQQDAAEFDKSSELSNFISTKAWDRLKTKINSLIVIDLPQEQITPRPYPYFYLLDVSSLHDVSINEDKAVEYAIFHLKGDQLCVIDDEFYRIFIKNKGTGEYDLISRFQYSTYNEVGQLVDGLGYAPVCSLWNIATCETNYIDKVGPLTNVLSDLDWFLFKHVSFKYLGLYGDYPIMVSYKEACSYKNEQGSMCEGGRVAFDYEVGDGFNTRYDECPNCAKSKSIGPGTKLTVDGPRDNADVDLLKNDPIRFIEISNDKLEWGRSELTHLDKEIFLNCVGFDNEAQNDQAKNEKQVMSGFESRQSVLEHLKKPLEAAEKFIWDTCYKLRYGNNYYLGSLINYGDKFYLQTIEEVDERYANAKIAGKPMFELANIRDLGNKTQNKNNPDELQRIKILEQLEPWPDLSLTQVQSLGLANQDLINYFVKLNFNGYIARFERENMDIVEFGSKNDLSVKIQTINDKLQEYAKQQITIARANLPGDGGNPNATSPGGGNRNGTGQH